MENIGTRRIFLAQLGVAGASALALPLLSFAAKPENKKQEEEDVSPAEDLMREHGGLNRILLIYDENLRRMRSGQDADPSSLKKSATIIRNFIEGYHEKLEEDFLFPRFEKAKIQVDLVKVLREQHKAGRILTDIILKSTTASTQKESTGRQLLQDALEKFNRMYRPHEAREDTILFPAFRKLVSDKEYKELGEKFEEREHELFGKEGFEGIVAGIAEIEKTIGIYDLSKFTPGST